MGLIEDFSFDISKAIFAFSMLICGFVVHHHIAYRIGIPIRHVVLSRTRRAWPANASPLGLSSGNDDKRRFGDRVVLGEIFAVAALFFGTLILIDSVVDFFPSFDTDTFAVSLVVGNAQDDPELAKIAQDIVPFIIGIVSYLALFTFALIFYIFNSDRISDSRSRELQRNRGADSGSRVSDAPKISARGTNQVNQTDATEVNNSAEKASAASRIELKFSLDDFTAAHERVSARAAAAGMSLTEFCEAEVYRRNNVAMPDKGDGTEAKILLETLLRE